jgi:hypothetical protein
LQLKDIWEVAWGRLTTITLVVGNAQGRIISFLFYFTVMVPFGLIGRFLTDPLGHKDSAHWVERHPVPNDIESAKKQG